MIEVNIIGTKDPNKWIMHLYKNDELIHSYVDAYSVLLGMCRVLIDISPDKIDSLIIYRNNSRIYATGKRVVSTRSRK